MNMNEYRLTKLMEELAEAAQRAAKMLQFGSDEVQPGQQLANHERLRSELLDVLIWIRALERCNQIDKITQHQVTRHAEMKNEKIRRMLQLSYRLGCVADDEVKV